MRLQASPCLSMLPHLSCDSFVAVCCSVLQYVAVCCSVLQYVAVCCSMLQGVAGCCRVLQCVAVCCSVLQCVAVRCSVFILHVATLVLWLVTFDSKIESRPTCEWFNGTNQIKEGIRGRKPAFKKLLGRLALWFVTCDSKYQSRPTCEWVMRELRVFQVAIPLCCSILIWGRVISHRSVS